MNAKSPKIVVLGGLNMDLVVHVPVIPKPGETVTGTDFATFPGGKGANQAVALRRLGADVTMIGRVGGDAFGEILLENLRNEGIHTDWVKTSPDQSTGVALITVEDSGQNNISVASGANRMVTVQDVTAALDAASALDLLVMPLEVPLEVIIAAARLAKGKGARVVLNPAPAQPLPDELLDSIDVIVPNESEAATLTGVPVDDEEHARQAALKLHERTGCSVVITLGERGALLFDAEQQPPTFTLLPAYRVKAVDTTAAGDAFVGGLSVGLGEGKSLVEAARLGSAAGAISVTRHGAQPSLPRREEVEGLIHQK